MIVWGGYGDSGYLNTGERYNASTDSWTATTTTNAPAARYKHTAVWTGSEMIVWGGVSGTDLTTGGRYNPGTDTWIATSTSNAPSARESYTVVWTGSEMIVWGGSYFDGSNRFYLNTGGKYNPGMDSWTATSTTNVPSGRTDHTAVWSGSEMIVWGGNDGDSYLNTGGRYNPSMDSWTATSTSNVASGRDSHTAVWTDSEMIIWGGHNLSGPLNTGGRYNPGTDSWTATTTTNNAPSARTYHTAVWTGSEMIVWGGYGDYHGFPTNTGGRYNPSTDSWRATSTANAPSGRVSHNAVWTGSEMIVWGGDYVGDIFSTGGRYCAQPPSVLGNISTRAFVQTGNNVMIGGFIVRGSQPNRVIIRAIGPELARYGVPNPLFNPTLELHDGTGALIASNDNWMTTIIGGIITSNQVAEIRASGHAPSDGRESAIIADLPAGNYTAIVRGVDNMTGVALVEAYDLSPETNSILGNISTRSFVQTGDNIMIGGFIVQGTRPKRVIVRAIGPELSAPPFNIPNALANPTLELHDHTGALIASNDNWQVTIIGGIITTSQVHDIVNSGHAPTDLRESAIIAELPPGNYTAIVRGVNNTTGVALVEVYDLQ
jgi:N-acetylneuraminic acid mutarotase